MEALILYIFPEDVHTHTLKHCIQDRHHKVTSQPYQMFSDLDTIAVDFLPQERAAERRVSKALQRVPGARLEVVPAAGVVGNQVCGGGLYPIA